MFNSSVICQVFKTCSHSLCVFVCLCDNYSLLKLVSVFCSYWSYPGEKNLHPLFYGWSWTTTMKGFNNLFAHCTNIYLYCRYKVLFNCIVVPMCAWTPWQHKWLSSHLLNCHYFVIENRHTLSRNYLPLSHEVHSPGLMAICSNLTNISVLEFIITKADILFYPNVGHFKLDEVLSCIFNNRM